MIKIVSFKVEGLSTYCLSDNKNPQFSFIVDNDQKDVLLKKATIYFNDEVVDCKNPTGNIYLGKPLKSFTKYEAKLVVEDENNNTDTKTLVYETGYLLNAFKGNFISDSNYQFKTKGDSPLPMIFHKKLELMEKVKSVKVYATALGIYDLYVGNNKIGNRYFAPGFTSYFNQLQYQCYDVTEQVKNENNIYFIVAGGWAVGSFVFTRKNRWYGDRQALLCDIHIEYENGKKEIIATDHTWDVSTSAPVLMADIYDGESYDANIDLTKVNYHKASNEKLRINPQLVADYSAPVIAHEELKPVKAFKSNSGKDIYDFGQNHAGVIKLRIKNAKQGQVIIVKHAEILTKENDLNTSFLRSAKATTTYICKDGDQEYSPTLTYMGYRYVCIEGIDSSNVEVTSLVLYSDIEQIGSFECSNALINRLQKNIEWSSKSNFVEIPTDCPQRDERMGWTGDINVFAKTAYFNFDLSRFINKWMKDLLAEQNKTGGVPNTIPLHGYGFPATMPKMAIDFWGDAIVNVPYADYLATGNTSLLKKSFEGMKKYVNACKFWANLIGIGKERYIWNTPSIFHFGDWITPDVPKMSQWQARSKWTATASLNSTASTISEIAKVLNNKNDQEYFANLANKVAKAYEWKFTDGNGKLKKEFQTGYVLPIYFKMFENKENQLKATENLALLVKKSYYCIGTGFPGTPYILFALADNNQLETAYKMLENTSCPSWLYEVKTGGTTIWERWDGLDENGVCSIGDDGTGGMISYNHYASGAVGDFLYRRVAGIEVIQAGYKKSRIKPLPGGSLTYAKASTMTPYGKISSSWEIVDKNFVLDVEVPYLTTCEVILPNGESKIVNGGSHHFIIKY